MEINDILRDVNEIFIDVLDNDEIIIRNETTADYVEDWDSLTHIQLIVAIEKHFKIKFTSQEITSWKDVGDMCKAISQRLK